MDNSSSDYHHGDMDIHEQAGTYKAFGVLMSWGCVVLGAFLVFLVLLTCTPTPLMFSALGGLVVLVLGALALSRKPAH